MEKIKKIFTHIKTRVFVGVIALVPIFAIASIIIEIWKRLSGAADIMVKVFELTSLLGSYAITFATAFILICVFYGFGWLVNFSLFQKIKNWIETNALQYIPGYLAYKAQMEEKVNPTHDRRKPVLITTPMGQRPALLIDSSHGKNTVFVPNCPDSNNGVVWIVEDQMVSPLPLTNDEFEGSLHRYGLGLYQGKA
jgi:uncharacterized membrane protein